MEESGFKDYDVTLWYGLMGPKGLSPEIENRLNAVVSKVLVRKETPIILKVDGAFAAGGTPAQFQALLGNEIAMWRQIVRKIDIKPD